MPLQNYQRLCRAVVSVQKWYRHWSETREVRGHYLALRRAAVVAQAVWRGQQVRRELEVREGHAHDWVVQQNEAYYIHVHVYDVHVHLCYSAQTGQHEPRKGHYNILASFASCFLHGRDLGTRLYNLFAGCS